MKRSSLVKIIFFSIALYANIRYALFLLNPAHIGNLPFFALNATADLISIIVLTFTWISCLHFELSRERYHKEVAEAQEKGKALANSKVSILVPVVNESIDIVKTTLEAAKKLKGTKAIYILDDGRRDELKELASQMDINYLRRESRDFFKSGNLNHAFKHIDSDFIAVFDSDFIAKENFLQETLPLFIDPTVGAVQTPQVYYNSENLFSKGMLNFQKIFYEYIMPSKHLVNSTFCVGTNVIYRSETIDEIGGVPLVNHSEDVFTALKMAEHKYRIAYLDKNLAYGLSPDNVISFFNQQFRWARGGLIMLLEHNTLFNKKLNFDQKISYFLSNMFYLTGLSLLIYLLSPFIAIIFNVRPINDAFFGQWLLSYGMFFVFNLIFYSIVVRTNRLESMALGIFCMIPYVGAFISVLSRKDFTWKPTNFLSGDTVTRILVPFLSYVIIAIGILYILISGQIAITTSYAWYFFWILTSTVLIMYIIFSSYKSIIVKNKI